MTITNTEAVSDERLTTYEMQVLLGTTISGCNMGQDRVFDLKAAWSRLYAMGLIDRADGLAIATPSGLLRINDALSRRSANSAGGGVEALTWQKRQPSEFLSRAETMLGVYRVWSHHEANGKWFWSLTDGSFAASDGPVDGSVSTEAEAKAAAQADFNQRILSAIVSSPVSAEVTEALTRMREYGEATNDGQHDGTLFRFADGRWFFLASQQSTSGEVA